MASPQSVALRFTEITSDPPKRSELLLSRRLSHGEGGRRIDVQNDVKCPDLLIPVRRMIETPRV